MLFFLSFRQKSFYCFMNRRSLLRSLSLSHFSSHFEQVVRVTLFVFFLHFVFYVDIISLVSIHCEHL